VDESGERKSVSAPVDIYLPLEEAGISSKYCRRITRQVL